MAIDKGEIKAAKSILWPDENVEMTVKQKRIGPGGSLMTPTTVIATDRRLIILSRASLGMRRYYEVIPYRYITSVRLGHGIMSSSVYVQVQGYDKDTDFVKDGKEEGEIDGLRNRDARELADYINRRVEQSDDAEKRDVEGFGQKDENPGNYVYCSKCGTKDRAGAKYCSKCGAKLAD